MAADLPPSGPWTGYYLYGHAGPRHRMRLTLTFAPDGKIEGHGVDDIAPFHIHGQFDASTSAAHWKKAYVGRHTVQYAGLYVRPSICGDWTLAGFAGGFWIWPQGLDESNAEETPAEVELPLQTA